MKIFVTGGTGYIGQELLIQLLQNGHTVHAICRNLTGRALIQHPHLQWFDGDLMDSQSIYAAMQGCEQVYHSAAYARVYAKETSTYYMQNVIALENVLGVATQLSVKKVVFTSSAGVIGPTGNDTACENSHRKVGFLNEYERTKSIAETVAINYHKRGLPVVIVRPSRVFGPGRASRSNPFLALIRLMLKSPVVFIPGDGNGIGCYSFVDDVVRGHLQAMEHGRSGERYFIGGENVSYNQLFKTIMEVSGKKVRMLHLPLGWIKLYSHLELMHARLGNYDPWIIPDWVNKYTYHAAYSSQKATEELGYQITPLSTGIEKTIDFIQSENL